MCIPFRYLRHGNWNITYSVYRVAAGAHAVMSRRWCYATVLTASITQAGCKIRYHGTAATPLRALSTVIGRANDGGKMATRSVVCSDVEYAHCRGTQRVA
jgi:hypothetical protein